MSKKEPHVYIIFLANHAPQRLFSTIDLIDVWKKALAEAAKTGKWYQTVDFLDDDGSKNIIAAYIPNAILSIVRGVTVPEDKMAEMIGKV